MAHGICQDCAERRGRQHEGQRRVCAEDYRDESADDSASDDRGEGVANPAETPAWTAVVLGQRAQAPWAGGHRMVIGRQGARLSFPSNKPPRSVAYS